VELVKHSHKGRAGWSDESEAAQSERMSGAGNPGWRGGVTLARGKGRYQDPRWVKCPAKLIAMARPDGFIMEHRLVVAQALGRTLSSAEVVHHMNHKTRDNAIENLALFASNSDHMRFHAHGTPEPLWRGSSHATTQGQSGA
jgi:hypothetical protein